MMELRKEVLKAVNEARETALAGDIDKAKQILVKLQRDNKKLFWTVNLFIAEVLLLEGHKRAEFMITTSLQNIQKSGELNLLGIKEAIQYGETELVNYTNFRKYVTDRLLTQLSR